MAELDPNIYTVAWIAPLEIEAQAALHMLDHRHSGRFSRDRGDDYVFLPGDLNGHNVVIATLPFGQRHSTATAAALASHVKKTFPNLWFGLLVGVAAGLPNLSVSPPRDIRLGDVLVGVPGREGAGIIAYDVGTITKEDGFQPLHNILPSTEPLVLSAIQSIKLMAPFNESDFTANYQTMKTNGRTNGEFDDPGHELDELYEIENEEVEFLVERIQRPDSERTQVWYGPIGSGDKLVKDTRKAVALRDKYDLIGLEKGAAGIMSQIPVGVIRGVCDYGDGRENKIWQPYAAAMAAAYAKDVLYTIKPKESNKPPLMRYNFTSEDNRCLINLFARNPNDDRRITEDTKDGLLYDAFSSIFENLQFQDWRSQPQNRLL